MWFNVQCFFKKDKNNYNIYYFIDRKLVSYHRDWLTRSSSYLG